MASNKTITVNGRLYDAVTGLPVDSPAKGAATKKASSSVQKPTPVAAQPATPRAPRPAGTPRPDFVKMSASEARPVIKKAPNTKIAPSTPRSKTTATSVHSTVQRSQTLNRRVTKKPAAIQRVDTRRPVVGKKMSTAQHADVSRFAKHPEISPVAATAPSAPVKKDAPAQSHPVAQRALARTQAKKKAMPTTAKQVKEQEISKALAAPKVKTRKHRSEESKKRIRRTIIISSVVVVVFLALLAVYKLVPSISVNIAAFRAGVSATYPEFTPDGYSLHQPVSFSDGEVTLEFESNSNDNFYTIKQTNSSWDSTAVLDSVVTPAAGTNYVTTKERGLTIYTYDSAAVWVNGGILYQIDSQAPLSGDQIRRIATSL